MPGCQKRRSPIKADHLLQLTQQNSIKYKRVIQRTMCKTGTKDTEYTLQLEIALIGRNLRQTLATLPACCTPARSPPAIATEAVSPSSRENERKTYWCHDFDLSASLDVIDHVTIRIAMWHFLLVVHCHRASIFNSFRDIRLNTQYLLVEAVIG